MAGIMQALRRITFVDDEAHIREIVQLTLEEIGGFQFQACESGMQALEMIPKFKPQLILLDVMMPQMNGIQTLHAIRQMPDFAAVPVVFVTAKAQPHELEQYRVLGAAEVIAKPFDPIEMPSQIRRIWEAAQTMPTV
jgi:CheY-like chemotaxis protein